MTDKLSLLEPYDPIEVELDQGVVFHTRDVTKDVQEKINKLVEERSKALEDAFEKVRVAVEGEDKAEVEKASAHLKALAGEDGRVEHVGRLLDARLVSANGGGTKPSTALKNAWKGNKVSISRIDEMIERIGEAEAERPTSPQKT
jgi:hypothetical protein